MADTLLTAYRGALSTDPSTALYTVPGGQKVVVRSIVIANTTGTTIDATLRLAGVDMVSAAPIGPQGMLVVDVNQILDAGEVLAGGGSAAGLRAHVCGVAVT